jgi:3-hydroxyacyl-[acyl-carrier-protein] dehydratase
MNELDAIDVVVGITAGKRGIGLRNVPGTLEVFDSHFPRFPVLPGVLVLGSLVELARRVCVASDPDGHWKLLRAGRVQYRHFVRPGDQLELTVELRQDATAGGVAVFSGEVRVDGALVTRARELHLVRAA